MDNSAIRSNVDGIRDRIAAACARAGRDPSEVKLIAVSKTHPTEAIRGVIGTGVGAFGENKVKEAEEKIEELGRASAEWHLIGHLQSNKARRAVRLFDVIHTVDSVELAERLERICIEDGQVELAVLVQVDLALEETKAGIAEENLPELVAYLKTCERLRLVGLMILPPFFEDPEATRPYFQRLRMLRDQLSSENAFGDGAGELSMGMSHDFEVAIGEGSTMVRVGTAIFGDREYPAS